MPSRNLILAWFRDPRHGVRNRSCARSARFSTRIRLSHSGRSSGDARRAWNAARTPMSSRSGPTGAARVSTQRSAMSWMVRLATARLAAPSTEEGPPINTIRPCNTEFDATVFGFAQNKPTATDVPVGAVLSADAPRPRVVAIATRTPAPVADGRVSCFLFPPSRRSASARNNEIASCAVTLHLKSKARPKRCGCGRANVTLHLLRCAARAGKASGIRSIPTIHGCACVQC